MELYSSPTWEGRKEEWVHHPVFCSDETHPDDFFYLMITMIVVVVVVVTTPSLLSELYCA